MTRDHERLEPLNPWTWRPSPQSWYLRLGSALERWQPSASLRIDRDPLVERVVDAVVNLDDWLLHPCVNALTVPAGENKEQRDLQLAAWIAAHCDVAGSVTTREPQWVWSPDGGVTLPPGDHELRDLSKTAHSSWSWAISVDPWCHSVGFNIEDSWASSPPEDDDAWSSLDRAIRTMMESIAISERAQQPWYAWVTAVSKVLVPLRSAGNGVAGQRQVNSASSRQLPGLLQLSVHDPIQVLEALIHETAHHHMFLVEASGPVVNPSHEGTYPSPLRPEPRPLRGVLAAYHALVYMCAFYVDVLRDDFVAADECERQLEALRPLVIDTETTLLGAERHLTELGRDFLLSSVEVAHHSD